MFFWTASDVWKDYCNSVNLLDFLLGNEGTLHPNKEASNNHAPNKCKMELHLGLPGISKLHAAYNMASWVNDNACWEKLTAVEFGVLAVELGCDEVDGDACVELPLVEATAIMDFGGSEIF